MRIAISGGHSTGLALIEVVKEKHPDWEIYYFGRKYSLEGEKALSFDYKVISQVKGVNFISLNTGRLQRRFSLSTLISLLKIPFGFIRSLYWLIKVMPQVIVSFGGYVSVPLVTVGWLLGIPSVTHEQTLVLGLATKINRLFARKVAVCHRQLLSQLSQNKGIYTGMPLRQSLKNKTNPGELKTLCESLKKVPKPLLYIATGKAGSQTINKVIKQALPELTEQFMVLHQVGELDYSDFKKGINNKDYYPVSLLASTEQAWVLNKADLVVSRSGANIVFELLYLKKPSVLIPLQFSAQDEQKKNAAWFVSLGGGELLLQKDLSKESLKELISKVYKNKDYYLGKLEKARIENGSEKLLGLVEEISSEKKVTHS